MMYKILLAVAVTLLTACAVPQKKISPDERPLWVQHQQQVKHIQQWDLRGRVSVRTENDGGQADIFWQQQNKRHYDIKLVAPFGAGTSYLQSRPQGVRFTTTSGEQVVDKNADALFRQVQGWNFPVSGLRYWMLGVPSPNSDFQLLEWSDDGQLSLLEQDGWHVELRSYQQVGQYHLPKKIFITRPDDEELDVRMIIRQWNLEI
ncbi:MAG: lipoprotein insertase outer membrane protein LolB [Gammaproteobacteria bacterium]|nr:lipoprotein insertase outer membrane protein LolB [Gammaproteobacteria bacterium]